MGQHKESAVELYQKYASILDADGFQLYRAAQRHTGFRPYEAFPYEDNRGAFEAADGHDLLHYLEADHFQTVTWEIVPGTIYERAVLGKVDTAAPEYRAFREAICADALDRMGLGDILKTKKKSTKKEEPER